jgi:hypothetical protein
VSVFASSWKRGKKIFKMGKKKGRSVDSYVQMCVPVRHPITLHSEEELQLAAQLRREIMETLGKNASVGAGRPFEASRKSIPVGVVRPRVEEAAPGGGGQRHQVQAVRGQDRRSIFKMLIIDGALQEAEGCVRVTSPCGTSPCGTRTLKGHVKFSPRSLFCEDYSDLGIACLECESAKSTYECLVGRHVYYNFPQGCFRAREKLAKLKETAGQLMLAKYMETSIVPNMVDMRP